MQIVLILVVLWFLATQVGKVTSSLNKASSAVAPLGQVGGALTGAISAGASAIGRFGGGGGGTSTSAPGPSYSSGGVTYTTSGGAGTVDYGPSQFSSAGVGSSSYSAYAPGASAPGPYAPSSGGSAFSDDLMTPDFADA